MTVSLSVPDAGLSPGVVAVIVVAVLLAAAVGAAGVVVYFRRKIFKLESQMGKYQT